MSIVTCTAKTRNDLSVARIVIEVLAQSWGYKCSVTYNDGKSFDVMVKDGAEANAIEKFKRLAPDLTFTQSNKKMATSTTESRKVKKESVNVLRDVEKDYYYLEKDGEIVYDEDGNNIHFDTREEAEEYVRNNYNESRKKSKRESEEDSNGFHSVDSWEGDMWEGPAGQVFRSEENVWLATSSDEVTQKEFRTKEEAEEWLLSL